MTEYLVDPNPLCCKSSSCLCIDAPKNKQLVLNFKENEQPLSVNFNETDLVVKKLRDRITPHVNFFQQDTLER